MMYEKEQDLLPSTALPGHPAHSPARAEKKSWLSKKLYIILGLYCALHLLSHFSFGLKLGNVSSTSRCPQADVVTPEKNSNLWDQLNEKIGGANFKQDAINWLSGAVRIPYVRFLSMLTS